ncbi:MAG: hypothetical protein ACE15B_19415 [Bryobacteraceae bacterium]
MNELEQLAKSYGLAIAILIVGGCVLAYTVLTLWRENLRTQAKLETVLTERIKALETITEAHVKRDRSDHP